MMGPKTLAEIREELRRALGGTGDDPIRMLNQLIRDAKPQRQNLKEALVSLERCLEEAGKEKRGTRRGGTTE
jgi:hypothetical protein